MKRFQLSFSRSICSSRVRFLRNRRMLIGTANLEIKRIDLDQPGAASEEAAQLLKGKNKKNTDLLTAIGQAYLEAGKISEAETYAALGTKG